MLAQSEDRTPPGILLYQKRRALSECPGFVASLQLSGGPRHEPLFVALRPDALEIYTAADGQYLYDLEGRPVRISTPDEYRFRGVSHQGTIARKRPAEHGGGLERQRLDPNELERSCRDAWLAGSWACDALEHGAPLRSAHPDPARARAQLLPVLQKVRAWTPARLNAEAKRFAQVYQPVPILPPDHYASLVLQATEGCTFNTCTFCALYRETHYRVRSVDEFDAHVRAALAFHGEGLRRFSHIFLGQANALAVPQPRLLALFETLRRHFELPAPEAAASTRPSWTLGHPRRFLGVGSFLDGFTGLTKSAADYAALRELGLVRTYLGVESGSAELLRWLKKPAQPPEMLETLRRLKGGGLKTDVILLVGIGGARFAEEHVRASLEFLRASPLQRGDRVFLSDLVEQPLAPYTQMMNEAGWPRLDAEQQREQHQQLTEGIRQLGLQAVPYRIEPFAY